MIIWHGDRDRVTTQNKTSDLSVNEAERLNALYLVAELKIYLTQKQWQSNNCSAKIIQTLKGLFMIIIEGNSVTHLCVKNRWLVNLPQFEISKMNA